MPRRKTQQQGGWIGPAIMGASMLAPHLLGKGQKGGKRGGKRGLISNGLKLAGTLTNDPNVKSAGYAASILGLGRKPRKQSGTGVKSTLSKTKKVVKNEVKKIKPAVKKMVVAQVKKEIFGGGLRRPQ